MGRLSQVRVAATGGPTGPTTGGWGSRPSLSASGAGKLHAASEQDNSIGMHNIEAIRRESFERYFTLPPPEDVGPP